MSLPNPSHEKIQHSSESGPSESGKSIPSLNDPLYTCPNGMPCHDQIQSFSQSAPSDFPDGDNSSPAVGSVALSGQGDQRNYASQSTYHPEGDMRNREGGRISNPTEAMPGAD
jgi:hypothetical protein